MPVVFVFKKGYDLAAAPLRDAGYAVDHMPGTYAPRAEVADGLVRIRSLSGPTKPAGGD